MVPRLFRTLPLLASVALFAAACQDAPTGPAAAPEAALTSQTGMPLALDQGASPYACFTSTATPQGPHKYRYGRLALRFPKEATAPNGATTRYRYRSYAKDGTIQRLANCVIPDTKMAAEAMNRRFGIRGEQMAQQKPRAGDDEGSITIQYWACVELPTYGETYCSWNEPPPAPIESPICDPNTAVESCDSGGTGRGGGDSPCEGCEPGAPASPPAPEDDALEDEGLPDCSRPRNHHERAFCMKGMNDTRRGQILKALDEIAKRGDVCKELAEAGRLLLQAGNLEIFTSMGFQYEGDPFAGAAPLGGDWVVLADYWTDTFETNRTSDGRNLQHTLAHELDHHLGRHHTGHGTSSVDKYNTPNSKSCAGL